MLTEAQIQEIENAQGISSPNESNAFRLGLKVGNQEGERMKKEIDQLHEIIEKYRGLRKPSKPQMFDARWGGDEDYF